MDQRTTTEADLYERLFPGRPLPYYLGEALRYPVRDIPTVEDYEREQGMIGVPTEEQSSRDVGQGALDYLTMAHGIASLLRGGTGAAQELMGKRRGQETFGKEMMDTSRRAQPQRWREIERENWQHTRTPDDPGSSIATVRRSGAGLLPPGGNPELSGGARPGDVVTRGTWNTPRLGDVEVYRIGEPIMLPGERTAQYLVVPSGAGGSVVLDSGGRQSVLFTSANIGEALAKARQLQNRLTLAVKDLGEVSKQGIQEPRMLRLPWERSTGPYGGDPQAWRERLLSPPPQSGRWSQPPNVETLGL